ncbi:MAG: lysylphosphatidylglycerol synthase transmembrane domain-containing protein [Myxococcales bacterium]
MNEAIAVPPRPRWPARVAVTLLAAAVLFVAVRSVDFTALVDALRDASWGWVALAVICNVVGNTVARVRRWQALLEPIPHQKRASFSDLVRVSYASGAVSNLLPARAGEAVRVVELKRRRGYPAGALIAAQLAEKGIEALSLGILFGVFAVLPGAHSLPLAIAGGVAVAAVALLAVLPRRAPGVAGRFLNALRAVHAERSWIPSLLWSLLSDAVDVVLVALCLRALGIEVHPAVWAMVLLSVNLALLLPSTPGNLGVLEAGAVVALVAAGVRPEAALAFALVYHSVHLIPGTLLGALAIWLPWR